MICLQFFEGRYLVAYLADAYQSKSQKKVCGWDVAQARDVPIIGNPPESQHRKLQPCRSSCFRLSLQLDDLRSRCQQRTFDAADLH